MFEVQPGIKKSERFMNNKVALRPNSFTPVL